MAAAVVIRPVVRSFFSSSSRAFSCVQGPRPSSAFPIRSVLASRAVAGIKGCPSSSFPLRFPTSGALSSVHGFPSSLSRAATNASAPGQGIPCGTLLFCSGTPPPPPSVKVLSFLASRAVAGIKGCPSSSFPLRFPAAGALSSVHGFPSSLSRAATNASAPGWGLPCGTRLFCSGTPPPPRSVKVLRSFVDNSRVAAEIFFRITFLYGFAVVTCYIICDYMGIDFTEKAGDWLGVDRGLDGGKKKA